MNTQLETMTQHLAKQYQLAREADAEGRTAEAVRYLARARSIRRNLAVVSVEAEVELAQRVAKFGS